MEQDDLLPLSALQHFAYCPRQFALIHIEQIWVDNSFTAEGQLLHQRANSGESETRGDRHTALSLRLVSHTLRLTGIADVVEFHRGDSGVSLPNRAGLWQPYPVEYKRGRSKSEDWDRLQLCAQAIALEEMLHIAIPEGALFYGQPRRREQVILNGELRDKTRRTAEAMHACWQQRQTPAAVYDKRCERCSLKEHCHPVKNSATTYLKRMLEL